MVSGRDVRGNGTTGHRTVGCSLPYSCGGTVVNISRYMLPSGILEILFRQVSSDVTQDIALAPRIVASSFMTKHVHFAMP
jgi:hypothetical protein